MKPLTKLFIILSMAVIGLFIYAYPYISLGLFILSLIIGHCYNKAKAEIDAEDAAKHNSDTDEDED